MTKLKYVIIAFLSFLFSLPLSYAGTASNLDVDSDMMEGSSRNSNHIPLFLGFSPLSNHCMNVDFRPFTQMVMANSADESAINDVTSEFPEIDLLRKKNHFTILLGAVYWKNLADIEYDFSVSDPTEYGAFKEWGYNIELGYHRNVSRWLENDVLAGINFGIFNNDNEKDFSVTVLPSGRRLKGKINARTLYLTPSVRLLIEKKGYPRFLIGAGVGYYLVDFAEQLSDGMEVDEYFEEDTIGGYLSLGVDFPSSKDSGGAALRFESKVHFVNFGDLGGIAPEAGDLKGPVYMFQVGITF